MAQRKHCKHAETMALHQSEVQKLHAFVISNYQCITPQQFLAILSLYIVNLPQLKSAISCLLSARIQQATVSISTSARHGNTRGNTMIASGNPLGHSSRFQWRNLNLSNGDLIRYFHLHKCAGIYLNDDNFRIYDFKFQRSVRNFVV